MTDEPIIEVRGLWKRYGLPPFLPWKKREVADHEWALRDISFTVPRGGSLGILGRNGAGKSTLLKLLAGVTPADKGSIAVRGKVFPMIELAAGMSTELSGLENIRILGTIMGLHRREIEKIIPEVEYFSELGEWLHKPVWQYSSGMVARLAFSIAINVNADILIVDEVLSVGDIQFQKKCEKAIFEVLGKGKTLIFVTHSPYQVNRLCNQGMVLKSGGMKFLGESQQASYVYLESGFASSQEKQFYGEQIIPSNYLREGSGQLRITKVRIEDEQGNTVDTLQPWHSYAVKIYYTAFEVLYGVNIGLRIVDSENRIGIALSASNQQLQNITTGNGFFKCTISHFPLLTQYVSLQIKIVTGVLLDMINDALHVKIQLTGTQALEVNNLAYAYTPSTWELFHGEHI
jgi:ABC-type polysaccharide/polyol phosphate transport system ATPase subunit